MPNRTLSGSAETCVRQSFSSIAPLVSLFYSMLQAAFVSFALGLLISIAVIVGEIKVARRRANNNNTEMPATMSPSNASGHA